MPDVSFAKRLKHARELKQLTQQEAANRCGLGITTIAHFEIGDRLPSYKNIIAISKGLGISSDYLLGLHDGLGESFISDHSKQRIREKISNIDVLLQEIKNYL
jgi:transcriptional regulator with XRE-family HTH domain